MQTKYARFNLTFIHKVQVLVSKLCGKDLLDEICPFLLNVYETCHFRLFFLPRIV